MRELREELERILRGKVAIIGVGNQMRGDDGFGSILVRSLKRRIGSRTILLIDAELMPENYVKKVREFKPERVLVIDAVHFGGSAGDVAIFGENAIKGEFMSTHRIPLSLFASLLREDESVEIFFLGVQPKKMELGDKMSEEVAGAIRVLLRVFSEILSSDRSAPSQEGPKR